MRNMKWLMAASLVVVTAGCVETTSSGYPSSSYNRGYYNNGQGGWYDQNGNWHANSSNNGQYNNGQYNNGYYRGRNYDGYGNQGGSYELRQTALNAGYNEGIKEGQNDRRRGRQTDFRNLGAYQKATQDYSSRLGDRELYRRYYREGFENGYADGYNGY